MQVLSRILAVLTLAGVCLAQLEPRARPMPPTGAAPAHPAATPATQKPQSAATRKAAPKSRNGKTAKKQAPEEALPSPRPLTPEQLPATQPTVTYRNGQLAIVANNSTMSDVLNQVRAQTGAQFEMTGVSAADRVYAKLGPGAPKDVLAALLGGTRFNFAILGGANDPNGIARVVLMPRTGGASAGPSGPSVAAQPQVFRQPQPQQAQEPEEEEIPVVEEEPPPPSEEQPEQQNQPGQVKTPEQLLQELQQMQQQQQQQNQQQQNPQQNPPQQQIPDREIPD
ncbi:MAG TPA: hypothetical protein VLA96_06195 [Terriglobales bacterium]|nr:hypothetical protein [Terriglobales bacterium]